VHTAEEFRLYRYKTNSGGDVLPEVIDKHNHAVDSIRYGIAPLIQHAGPQALIDFKRAPATTEPASKQREPTHFKYCVEAAGLRPAFAFHWSA